MKYNIVLRGGGGGGEGVGVRGRQGFKSVSFRKFYLQLSKIQCFLMAKDSAITAVFQNAMMANMQNLSKISKSKHALMFLAYRSFFL